MPTPPPPGDPATPLMPICLVCDHCPPLPSTFKVDNRIIEAEPPLAETYVIGFLVSLWGRQDPLSACDIYKYSQEGCARTKILTLAVPRYKHSKGFLFLHLGISYYINV